MNIQDQSETVALKACRSCGVNIFEVSGFCRWCGVRQLDSIIVSRDQKSAPQTSNDSIPNLAQQFVTTSLYQADLDTASYRSVSGSLVRAIMIGVSANASKHPGGPISRSVAFILISIAVGLSVLVLSPLEAYGAVKTISHRL